jgi:hypothetical protein
MLMPNKEIDHPIQAWEFSLIYAALIKTYQ